MNVLITGVSGQDGRLLSNSLSKLGYKVTGTTRRRGHKEIDEIRKSLPAGVSVVSLDTEKKNEWIDNLTSNSFDIIYHLSAQSSVGKSFQEASSNITIPGLSTYALLEAVRTCSPKTKIILANSTEVFGSNGDQPINENSPKNPMSPYAVGKINMESVAIYYRSIYGLWVSNVYMSNHESIYRGTDFVTMKIAKGAYDIYCGNLQKIRLGNLSVIRDWGWAPEYTNALIALAKLDEPEDVIIATGVSISLQDFACEIFNFFNLSLEDCVELDESLLRSGDPSEVHYSCNKAKSLLNWTPSTTGLQVPRKLAYYYSKSILDHD